MFNLIDQIDKVIKNDGPLTLPTGFQEDADPLFTPVVSTSTCDFLTNLVGKDGILTETSVAALAAVGIVAFPDGQETTLCLSTAVGGKLISVECTANFSAEYFKEYQNPISEMNLKFWGLVRHLYKESQETIEQLRRVKRKDQIN